MKSYALRVTGYGLSFELWNPEPGTRNPQLATRNPQPTYGTSNPTPCDWSGLLGVPSYALSYQMIAR